MRRLLLSVLCLCLLSTGAFAQTSGSPGGLVVFETFGSTAAANATAAGVLAGVMANETVFFASQNTRLARNLGLAIVNPNAVPANVTITLLNGSDGTMNSAKTITVGPHQQVSKFISEFFVNLPQLQDGFEGSIS